MYQWIYARAHDTPSLPVTRLCSALGVSRSGYYNWLGQKDAPVVDKDAKLRQEIHEIVLEFPGYGYRRVTYALRRCDYVVNHKRVLRLMREENLVTGVNQLWVADITYIGLPDEYIYLASLIDVYSGKCVGWHISDGLDTSLPLTALERALESRSHLGLTGLIHHSDRGVQYASGQYIEYLESHGIFNGIFISMSRKGCPQDNAYAESFIKTVKVEEAYLYEYDNRREACERISHFIDDVYNQKRLHSSLGYMPPDEFEERMEKSITLRVQSTGVPTCLSRYSSCPPMHHGQIPLRSFGDGYDRRLFTSIG
jgi:transposase InsO family protein